MAENTERPAPAAPTEESSALVPFLPENVNQAWKLAGTLAKSQLVPRGLQGKPHDLLVTLITGRELGLSPMQSIRGMHVIEGKAVMSSDMMAALVMSRTEVCEYLRLVETSATLATYATKRKGYPDETRLSYTIEDAQRAGLTGKDNWKKHPAAMLRARCISAICRAVYPDLVGGVYEPDEAREFAKGQVVELTPVPGESRLDRLTADLRGQEPVTETEPTGETVDVTTGEVLDVEPEKENEFFTLTAAEAEAATKAETRKESTRAAAAAATTPKAAKAEPALPFASI